MKRRKESKRKKEGKFGSNNGDNDGCAVSKCHSWQIVLAGWQDNEIIRIQSTNEGSEWSPYWFDDNGYMATGWKETVELALLDVKNGAMATGWKEIGEMALA